MIVKIFGAMDLIAASMFVFLRFGFFKGVALFFAGYLILKSLVFLNNIASWIDFGAGIYLALVVLVGLHPFYGLIFVIWLIQKGFFSLLA